MLSSIIRLFRTRNRLFWLVQKKIVLLAIGYGCAVALDWRFIRLISPFKFVAIVVRSRTSDFYLAGLNNALLSVSDRHIIRWLTSSFSYAGVEADLVVFGLRPRHRLSHAFAFPLLYFASFLRALGRLDEAAQLYDGLKRRKGLLGAYGYLGLADLLNLVLLWEKHYSEMDARVTNFELYGGLRNFLVERHKWLFAVDASEREVRRLCIKAVLSDRSIPFGYYELARYHDQSGNIKVAARFARIALRRTHKRVETQPFLEREACRLEMLGTEVLTPATQTVRSKFEALTKGDARLVRAVLNPSQLDQTADSFESRTKAETRDFSYMLHTDGSSKRIEKSLEFAPLQVFKVRSGFIPGFSGAPFVSDEGYSVTTTTAYSSFPGREIFVPAWWGGHRDKELFVEKNSRFLKDIVCLPGISANFYHFVLDMLGSLSFIDPADLEGRQLLAFGGPLQRFQKELMAELAIPEERLTMLPHGTDTIRFENGIFPCYASAGNVSNPHVARWLRSRFYRPKRITPGNRIYLARRTARDFSTHDRQSVQALMTRFGFRVVHPETMTIAEIRRLLADAEAVAIDAGAAVVNLLFAPLGAKAILIGSLLGYTECFTPLVSVCEQDLHVVLGGSAVHPKYLFAWSQLEPVADIASLRRCLESIF